MRYLILGKVDIETRPGGMRVGDEVYGCLSAPAGVPHRWRRKGLGDACPYG